MKKIIFLLFTFQLIIISICGLDIFQNTMQNNMLYKDTTGIILNFDSPREHSDDFGTYINYLGNEHNICISRYVFKNENDVTIYTSDSSLDNKIKLKDGSFPKENSNEFISNTSADDSEQCGTFEKIDPKTKIVIKNITETNNFTGSGIYYLKTTDSNIVYSILDDLNKNVANAELYSKTDALSLPITSQAIGTITLVSLCVLAAIVHYSVDKLKYASIMRINGFSIIKIIKILSLKVLKIMLPGSIAAYIISSVYYIYLNKLNYFGILSAYFAAASALCIAVSICVVLLIVLLYLKRLNKVQIIKGRTPYILVNCMHYGLKIIFIVFLLFSANQLLIKSSSLSSQLANLSQWDKAKNLYSTTLSYTGEHDFAIGFELNKKIQKFYNEMADSKGAFIANCFNYDMFDGIYDYDLNCEDVAPEVSPYGKCITINENYLKNNPIESSSSSVSEQIIHSPSVLNILVPENLRRYENDIRQNYLDYFYFQKVRVNNIYNDELGFPADTTDISDLNLNIIYVKDNQSYFTYKPNIEAEKGNIITDPIAVIYTANVNNSFTYSYLTNCFYFYSDSEDPYGDISSIVSEYDLNASIQKVSSVYDKHGKEIQDLKKEQNTLFTFVIILFLSSLMITYNLIAGYYEKNRYKLYIKKLFGYSIFRKNRLFIFSLLLINIIPIVIMSVLYGINILLIGISLILIECIAAVIIGRSSEKKSFNSIIKGEH